MKTLILVGVMTTALTLSCYGQFYMEAGPWYRGDMEVSVEGGSRAAASGLHAARAGTQGSLPVAQGSILTDDGTAQVFRQFDDGYVGPSGWAWAQAGGQSQYFGYDNAGQYDAIAGTLNFTRSLDNDVESTMVETRVTPGAAGWSGQDSVSGAGVQLAAGYMLDNEGAWRWSAQLQLGWLTGISGGFRNREAYSEQVDQRVIRQSVSQHEAVQYSYDTFGNPAFPGAPYAMTDPAGVGPMISDTPESVAATSQSLSSSSSASRWYSERAVSLVDLDVDASVLAFGMGPRVMWQAIPRLAFMVQPAVTLNFIDIEGRRSETFSRADGSEVGTWQDQADEQKWRVGLSLQAAVKLDLVGAWYMTAGGGYNWVDEANFDVGPDHVTLDISGFDLSVAIGRQF